MANITATVFDIFRGTTHDGPGLRDTVFFKGCPLRCGWCHNPEGILPTQQIWWEENRCIGCATCKNACSHHAISFGEGLQINHDKCKLCLACTQSCPTRALQPIAKKYTVTTLKEELLRDSDYYTQFHGGVTASGGECTMQHEFVAELFQSLHQDEINTALDTCGYAPYTVFKELLPHTDYILYDIKLLDCQLHKQFTGVDNHLILDNIKKIIRDIRAGHFASKIWIRTPLIPDATATRENIAAIADFLAPYLGDVIERWEMCAFNNACTSKYRKLSKNWSYGEKVLLQESFAEELRQTALNQGIDSQHIILTGILL